MVRRVVVAVSVALSAIVVSAPKASAQEPAELTRINLSPETVNHAIASGLRLADLEQMGRQIQLAPVARPKLSGLMTSLYASTAVMQALDVHSTLKAFNVGAVEGNPLMSGIAKNRIAFVTAKAAVAASTMFAVRRIARHNKVAAVITSLAVNSGYAMIVRHNYNVARGR